MRTYTCDKCGHKNYATAADLEAERRVMRYPDAPLGEQVRPYDQTFGVAALLRRTFFPEPK